MKNIFQKKNVRRAAQPFNKERFKRNLSGWLIMAPSLILFAFFIWAPLVSNIELSFYSTQGFNKVDFVGFANYIAVFEDPLFIKAFFNTFKYVFWSLIIGFLLPIFLGLLLSEVIHLKGVFRIGLYFPGIISGIAVVIMWSFLLDPNAGAPLNAIIQAFGGQPWLWLDDPNWTIPLIVMTMTWRGAGGTMLIYLSTLQTTDVNLYEAARLEGANAFQRVRYVTIPHLMPTIKMLFILQIITVLQVFYEPLVLTKGGGPNGASESLMLLAYQYAFGAYNKPAMAAATGVILSIIIITLTLVYLWVVKRQSKEDIV